jgi:hypothetical protein
MPDRAIPRRSYRNSPAGRWRFARFHGRVYLSHYAFAPFAEQLCASTFAIATGPFCGTI